ncbi:MAG: hypothetical protein JNL70_26105 [Saprospiraceae bacterium]|nr:hypothetical protein [Saprospiraceae bacterium]
MIRLLKNIIVVVGLILFNTATGVAQCPTTTYPLCSGESYTLTAQNGLTNIQWQVDNGSGYSNISGATNAVYIASAVGKYKYTAKDANNCTIELCCPFELVAGNCTTPCPTTTYPLCMSESYTLTAQSGLTNIQWQVDNGGGYSNISGATNAVYVASAIGKYKYTAKDANNCTIELCCPFELVAGTNCTTPCPTTTYPLCMGESYTLTAQSGLTNIQWQVDNGSGYSNISGATNAVYVASAVGKYKYTAKDANNCTIELCCPFEIVANPTPDFTLSKSMPCPGTLEDVNITNLTNALSSTATLSIDGGAFSAYPNPSVLVGLSAGSHNITVRNANGCSTTKPITISPIVPRTCISVTITRSR